MTSADLALAPYVFTAGLAIGFAVGWWLGISASDDEDDDGTA